MLSPLDPATWRGAAFEGDMRIIESVALPYDLMVISTKYQAFIVGEIAHFVWRLRQIELNNACRETCRRQIESMATEILGEPWTVRGTK